MADIATVLKKTIDGLPTNNPDVRQKVYTKARAAILGRLEARDPRPDQATVDKQMAGIDRIIAAVESEYAFKEQVDDALGEGPAAAGLPGVPPAPQPEAASAQTPLAPAIDPAAPDFPAAQPPAAQAEPVREPVPAASGGAPATAVSGARPPVEARSSGLKALVWVAAIVLVLGGGGYAAWVNQDILRAQYDRLTAPAPDAGENVQPATSEGENGAPAGGTPGEGGQQAAATAQENAKFTQRLLADGTEVDPGVATDKPSPVGEGTSVAQATQPSTLPSGDATTADGQNDAVQGEAGQDTAAATEQPQKVAVGQRAIFYEERTSSDQETADQGSVVWTKVEESPGEGEIREPAIRADVAIAEKDLTLRMTIRRNTDKTLPASHIIELVFVTPDGFPGGAVDDVLRVAFKESEQSAGNPLLGLSVKIDDGLFHYALTDGAAEVETNTTLIRRQSWIDVTILYRTGRRALITMEKGIPGGQVFDEVLKAWSASAAATGG